MYVISCKGQKLTPPPPLQKNPVKLLKCLCLFIQNFSVAYIKGSMILSLFTIAALGSSVPVRPRH